MYEKTNLINNCPCFDDAKVRRNAKTRKSIQRNRRILQRNGRTLKIIRINLVFCLFFCTFVPLKTQTIL